MKKGFFITIEGGEGSGKSTVIQNLAQYLRKMEEDVLVTREPGGLPVSEKIREVLMNEEMDVLTETMLFASSRNEIIKNVIKPALDEDKFVVCDRFLDSNLVYQGYVKGLGVDKVLEINNPILKGCMPDLTFYLDLDPEEGLKRIKQNNRETNRFDEMTIDFHRKVREGYRFVANHKDHKKRIRVIDASKSKEEVFRDCVYELLCYFDQEVVACLSTLV